jgi:hypothetical protein
MLLPTARVNRSCLYAAFVLAAALGVGVCATSQTALAGYPEPRLAPVAWEFSFEHQQPRRVMLRSPSGDVQAYWYMTYTVTNNTEQERSFVPEFEMVTRTGDVLPANFNIPMGVYEAIARRERQLPLVPPQEASGRLLIGEDRARSSVAIWREPMAEMGQFQIFVAGLSGEISEIKNSQGEAIEGDDGLPLLVRKTKRLVYRVLGDDRDTGEDVVREVNEEWVMR